MLFNRISIRPHFDIPLAGDGGAVLAAISERLERPGAPFVGKVLAPRGYLRMPRTRRSLLSPDLDLEILERDGDAVLRGRFSPRPSVWMGFRAIFLVLALVGLGGLVYGLAQLMLTGQESPRSMLLLPLCAGLIVFVYGAAFVAQGLVQNQMYEMRAWVENLAGGFWRE